MGSEGSGDNSHCGEADEAIRIYQDYSEKGSVSDEDSTPSSSESGPPSDGSPPLEGTSAEKKYNGNISGSDDEGTNLAVEPTQKRFERLEGDRREALNERVKDENKLRNKLGNALLLMVGIQLGASDIFLGFFMWNNAHTDTVMLAWLSSCVVEVIGIVLVITRSIFPKKNQYADEEAEYMTQAGRMFQIPGAKTSQEEDVSQDTATKQM